MENLLNLSNKNVVIILIDIQKDFVSGEGVLKELFPDFFDKKHPDIPNKIELIENVSKFISIARELDIPLIYIQADYSNLNESLSLKFKQGGVFGRLCIPNTSGYDISSIISPLANDIIINKSTHSAFISTELDNLLQTKFFTRKNLVLIGLEGNVCIESTMRDASALGYHVIIPKDLVSSSEPELHFAMLKNCEKYFGHLTMMTELVTILKN